MSRSQKSDTNWNDWENGKRVFEREKEQENLRANKHKKNPREDSGCLRLSNETSWKKPHEVNNNEA